MKTPLYDYVTNSAGFVAGKLYPKGALLQLTRKAAKYENVSLAPPTAPAARDVAEKTERAARKKITK